ncbi:MAG TPA: hypothetical protein VH306_11720 [Gaiellaceae bacterium]|jgi:hypothetical protein
MVIQLGDPSLAAELREHFRRAGFVAVPKGELLEVTQPDAPSDEQARREIEVHLRIWLVMHPASRAELVD